MNERSIERVEQQKAGGICGAACAPERVISQQLCCGEYLLTRLNNHSGLRPDGGDFYTGDGGPATSAALGRPCGLARSAETPSTSRCPW